MVIEESEKPNQYMQTLSGARALKASLSKKIIVVMIAFSLSLSSFNVFGFGGVPILGYLVGLFTAVVGLYVGLTAWSVSETAGLFALFAMVVGGLTMVVTALGLRVRR